MGEEERGTRGDRSVFETGEGEEGEKINTPETERIVTNTRPECYGYSLDECPLFSLVFGPPLLRIRFVFVLLSGISA